MDMEFYLQASNPRLSGTHDAEDSSLIEAIQTVFPLNSEAAYLVWKGIHVPISYQDDISFMIDDLIELLRRLLAEDSGQMRIEWPSTTFFAKWDVSWTPKRLRIKSKWMSVRDYLVEPLNQAGPISVSKSAFLAEWSAPLEIVMRALRSSGYRPEDLQGMPELQDLLSALPGRGCLYEGVASE